jgi:hypothetical protein
MKGPTHQIPTLISQPRLCSTGGIPSSPSSVQPVQTVPVSLLKHCPLCEDSLPCMAVHKKQGRFGKTDSEGVVRITAETDLGATPPASTRVSSTRSGVYPLAPGFFRRRVQIGPETGDRRSGRSAGRGSVNQTRVELFRGPGREGRGGGTEPGPEFTEANRPRNVVGVDHADPPPRFADPTDGADSRLPSNRNMNEIGVQYSNLIIGCQQQFVTYRG